MYRTASCNMSNMLLVVVIFDVVVVIIAVVVGVMIMYRVETPFTIPQ